jgi:hypothetical protein
MESVANSSVVRSGLNVRSSRNRSRVTNGKSAFIESADGRGPYFRRWRDIVAEISNDLGGADLLSEAQKQLIRRAATISVSCEKLEQKALTAGRSILDEDQGHNGPTSLQILQEAARVLHALARYRMRGTSLAAVSELPREEQDRVADLLTRASDIAAKAHTAAGCNIDLELYGTLCDRLNRCFVRLGIERKQKTVASLPEYLAALPPKDPSEAETEEAELVEVVPCVSGAS